MMRVGTVVILVVAVCAIGDGQLSGEPYYGTRIGKFSTHFHDVRGDVYAVDDRTLFIKGFNYDGKGVDTFFWAGDSIRPDPSGFPVPDERGSLESLKPYSNKDIILRLPQGRKLKDIRWFSVWSKRFRANFGSLIFPKSLHPPRPVTVGHLQNTKHGVSSGEILVIDTQTFLVQDFSYDGSREGVFWWLSRGMKPNTGGLQLLDENHSRSPLRKYINETVVVSVPDGQSIFDYDTLSVWSGIDVEEYGMVRLPKDVKVPPSARALGITPQNKLNCEMLNDNLGFEARWVIEDDQLIMQLVGKFDANEYMLLGFSKDDTETKFSSSDAVLVYLSEDGRGNAIDYYIKSTERCEDGQGMCPDTIFEDGNNSITLLNAGKVKDSVTVTFRRNLKAADEVYDQNIYTDGPQAVLWAVGDISESGEAKPPKLRTRGNLLLDFGREPMWNCPLPQEATSVDLPEASVAKKQKNVAKLHCPMDLTFRAQLGPSMKVNRPERIWYINGLPSPDLTLQKGQTYTFIVEGGNSPPNHHPLYITSSEEGGIYRKILEANEDGEAVYAGVASDPISGALLPTAEGRLCEWTSTNGAPEFSVISLEMETQSSLSLSCAPGEAGILKWTPDISSSEPVYYQSFIEKNMGGRIKIVDFCEETNPHHYVQESQRRENEENSRKGEQTNNENLERESEDYSDDTAEELDPPLSEQSAHVANGDTLIEESGSEMPVPTGDQRGQVSPHESNPGKPVDRETPHSETKTTQHNVAHGHKTVANNFVKQKYRPVGENMPITQSALDQEASEGVPSLFSYPRDEYERSDTNILDLNNENRHRQPFPLNLRDSHRDNNRINADRNAYIQSNPMGVTNPKTLLNIQFEGGFVPLVLNPSKERESTIQADYAPPPPQFRRPHRPFLFNESIPFHGTFKPGVPDFSGFNISHYTQGAATIDQNYLADHVALLSDPRPKIVQRPVPSANGLAAELYRRPYNGMQRPHMVHYGPNAQMMVLPGHQEPMFFQLPAKSQPNFLMPRPSGEDLDEGSSQRVPISLQSPKEKPVLKNLPSGFPVRQPVDRNVRPGYLPPKPVPQSPPIQRRPDIVDEEDTNRQVQKPQGTKFQSAPNRGHSDQHSRPQQLLPPSRPRPHPFERIPQRGNNALPNRRQRPPVPERPPPDHAVLKQPTLFMKRPGATLPMEHGARPNGPFMYRLPDRPVMHVAEQQPRPAEIGSLDARRTPPLNNQGAALDQMPHSPPKEHPNHPAHMTNIRPLQEEQPLLQPNFIPVQPMHLPSQNHPSSPVHRPPNILREHENSFLSNKNLDTETENKQIPVIPHFNPLPEHPSENESDEHEEIEEDEETLEYDGNPTEDLDFIEENHTVMPQEIEKTPETDEASEDRIISVEQTHSQEIHLPPLSIHTSPEMDYFDEVHKTKHDKENWQVQQPPKPDTQQQSSHSEQNGANLPEKPHHEIPKEGTYEPKHYIKQLDYDYDAVPFGARLSVKQTGGGSMYEKHFSKPTTPKRPSYFPARRQPQFSSPPAEEIHYAHVTKAPQKPEQKQLPSLHGSPPQKTNQHVPLEDSSNVKSPAAPEPEKLSFATYPGRKNILPSEMDQNVVTASAPPKVPENITLPHISEKPPTHDNGTDYSILSHVLSLIGGEPRETNSPSPRSSEGVIPHTLNKRPSHT